MGTRSCRFPLGLASDLLGMLCTIMRPMLATMDGPDFRNWIEVFLQYAGQAAENRTARLDRPQAAGSLLGQSVRTGPAAQCSVNAHFNKSAGSDPLSLIMGSAAFGNVARAALRFARDTEAEDGSCIISQAKNNLGRLDLPSLRYRIDPATIDTDERPAEVEKLVMLGEF